MLKEWNDRAEQRKTFAKDWSPFWVGKWYSETIRLVRGRTLGEIEGVEGRSGSLESQSDRRSPYQGRFLYVDELIARSQGIDELREIATRLFDFHHEWKSNTPANVAKDGVSILTLDRSKPLPDSQFDELMWQIDIKIDLIQRDEYRPPSSLGDYALPAVERRAA